MKRICMAWLILLLVCCALPASAAQRLALQPSALVSVDVVLPELYPSSLPRVKIAPKASDLGWARELFDPEKKLVSQTQADIQTFGGTAADTDYLLLDPLCSRIYFVNGYFRSNRFIPSFSDERADNSNFFETDAELDFLSREAAVKKASEIVSKCGGTLVNPRVITIDKASYDKMLETLKTNDAQVNFPREALLPFDTAHEGYYITFELELFDGISANADLSQPGFCYISRSGIELFDSGMMYTVKREKNARKILSPKEAILRAQQSLRPGLVLYRDKSHKIPAFYDRVTLCYYQLKNDSPFFPVYCLSAVSEVEHFEPYEDSSVPRLPLDRLLHPVPYQNRSFSRLTEYEVTRLTINAYTGELVDRWG